LNDETGYKNYIFLTQRGAEVYAEDAEGVIGLGLAFLGFGKNWR